MATILKNKPYIIVSNLPLIRGHFFYFQGWPNKEVGGGGDITVMSLCPNSILKALKICTFVLFTKWKPWN